jgi:predicted RecB family endonuclease
MQVTDLSINSLINSYRPLTIANPTLNTLIAELGVECQRAIMLVHQLQLPNISDRQKVDVLAELNASIIHLQSHCDDDLQDLIADELENISSS